MTIINYGFYSLWKILVILMYFLFFQWKTCLFQQMKSVFQQHTLDITSFFSVVLSYIFVDILLNRGEADLCLCWSWNIINYAILSLSLSCMKQVISGAWVCDIFDALVFIRLQDLQGDCWRGGRESGKESGE